MPIGSRILENLRCGDCGERSLRMTFKPRMFIRPIDPWKPLIVGEDVSNVDVVTVLWPTSVCDHCGFESLGDVHSRKPLMIEK